MIKEKRIGSNCNSNIEHETCEGNNRNNTFFFVFNFFDHESSNHESSQTELENFRVLVTLECTRSVNRSTSFS